MVSRFVQLTEAQIRALLAASQLMSETARIGDYTGQTQRELNSLELADSKLKRRKFLKDAP